MRVPHGRAVAIVVALAAAIAACGDDGGAAGPTTATGTPTTAGASTTVTSERAPTTSATSAPGPVPTTAAGPRYDAGRVRFDAGVVAGSHDCVPPDGGGARIAWRRLRNPIYQEPAMVKDQAVRFVDGAWHMFFSTRTFTDGSMGYATSTDWTDWAPVAEHPDAGGSPDITRAADGRYVLAHHVDDPTGPVPDTSKIAYRASDDLAAMVAADPVRIAPGIYDGDRLIDAALAHTEWGVYALFKRGARESVQQVTTLVRSPSGSLDGPWELVGDVESVGWFENYQLLTIDGKWHLLGTAIPFHDPTLYRMDGDPADPASWLDWTLVRAFAVPQEEWNAGPYETRGITFDIANSAYLCDARAVDGYFYLFYAGATELETNDGRGHQKIGVARSTDLEHWSVPPG